MKNNLKIITAAIFISCLLLISCKKYEKELTIVQGTVVNQHSGLLVPDVKLRIYYYIYGDDWDLIKRDTIAEFYSDAEGHFYYEFYALAERKNEKLVYYLACFKDEYCYYIEGGGKIWTGQLNERFLHGSSGAYLQYHLINQNPFDVNDEICVNSWPIYPDYDVCITGNNIDGFYMPHQFGDPYGDTYTEIRWVVTKNGISTEYKDTVYRIPCDTTLITINY